MSLDIRPLARSAADMTPEGLDFLALACGPSMAVGEAHRPGELARGFLAFLADCPEPISVADVAFLRDQALDAVVPPRVDGELDEMQSAWLGTAANAEAFARVLADDADQLLSRSDACRLAMRDQASVVLDGLIQGLEVHIDSTLDEEPSAPSFGR